MPKVRPELIDRLRGEGYVTVREASKRTEMSERSIRTWTRSERLNVRRVGRLVFVEIESLNRLAGVAP